MLKVFRLLLIVAVLNVFGGAFSTDPCVRNCSIAEELNENVEHSQLHLRVPVCLWQNPTNSNKKIFCEILSEEHSARKIGKVPSIWYSRG